MVQTPANRLDRLAGVQFLVADEAHHVTAATWLAIIDATPKARVLGVTATPERLDGKGLAEVFGALVIGPTVRELIDAGYLSEFVVYAPQRVVNLKGARTVAGDYAVGDLARRMSADFVLSDAVTEYRNHLDGPQRSHSAPRSNIRGSSRDTFELAEFERSTSKATRPQRSAVG
jgi:superfamily II DNA or RNA helicase